MDSLEKIKNELSALGFSEVGVSVYQLDVHEKYYKQFLEKGFHGEMSYLKEHLPLKENPELLLEGIRSVIVASYPCSLPNQNQSDYQIASYAYGRDYHRILQKKRKAFYRFFSAEFPEAKIYGASDSGPLLEKAWAERAGLAFMGKHSNMIQKENGSYFFLNLFLTDLSLPNDESQKKYCGSCTRCIDICPTGAIVDDYVVDARLCISYLTIEYKGVIPQDLRKKIGSHLFGCDDCQQVCPWNRFASSEKVDEDLLWTRDRLSLHDLAYLSEEEFKTYFQASPILRSKYEGFRRNLAIVIGNSQNLELKAAVLHLLETGSDLVKAHAIWAYAQLDPGSAATWVKNHNHLKDFPLVSAEMDTIDAG